MALFVGNGKAPCSKAQRDEFFDTKKNSSFFFDQKTSHDFEREQSTEQYQYPLTDLICGGGGSAHPQ